MTEQEAGVQECEMGDRYLAEKDYEQAIIHYRKAAQLGNKTACRRMGDMYRNGWGVDKNPLVALTWFRKA